MQVKTPPQDRILDAAMRVFGLCFDSSATGVHGGHAVGLVALSFLVAAVASYSALDMAGRWRSSDKGKGDSTAWGRYSYLPLA